MRSHSSQILEEIVRMRSHSSQILEEIVRMRSHSSQILRRPPLMRARPSGSPLKQRQKILGLCFIKNYPTHKSDRCHADPALVT
ncbi:hypothetical protein EYF80_002864 [Liparis tanakae]|uniref:Uncharacterized protein n=1 Tax=Liparis tanakae TaxID=230148 RepID=A0A4Z2JA60_9TELE|nr:hypothetical protein EYF80_002864 [Liparis tanakae]